MFLNKWKITFIISTLITSMIRGRLIVALLYLKIKKAVIGAWKHMSSFIRGKDRI